MKRIFSHFILGATLLVALSACTSFEKQQQVEAIASHRATIIANNLPIEHGPLTIVQARAKGYIIELVMIYNDDSDIAISPEVLMENSIKVYCVNKEVVVNLDHGIAYNIKVRDPRGQLLAEQMVSQKSCSKYR